MAKVECTSYFLLNSYKQNITSLSLLVGTTVKLSVIAVDILRYYTCVIEQNTAFRKLTQRLVTAPCSPKLVFNLMLISHQQSFSYVGTGHPALNQYKARINVSCSRTQRSNAGEARTRGLSVSSQALFH